MLNNSIVFEYKVFTNAFFRASLIEAWERGIEKIQDVCRNKDVPLPDTSFDGSGYWVKFTYKESQIRVSPKMSEEMSEKISDRVLRILTKNPTMTLKEVARLVHRNPRTTERIAKKLKDEGKLERVGSKKKRLLESY